MAECKWRMTQVIFKRPYYKGGSFPFRQRKGLGHILPWPCLGSERGKGGKMRLSKSFSHVADHALPSTYLQTSAVGATRPSVPPFEQGQCCPRTGLLPLPRVYNTHLSGRQKCFCLALPKPGPEDEHTSTPHTCLAAAWVPFWPFILTFLMRWQVGSRVPRVIILWNKPLCISSFPFLPFFFFKRVNALDFCMPSAKHCSTTLEDKARVFFLIRFSHCSLVYRIQSFSSSQTWHD